MHTYTVRHHVWEVSVHHRVASLNHLSSQTIRVRTLHCVLLNIVLGHTSPPHRQPNHTGCVHVFQPQRYGGNTQHGTDIKYKAHGGTSYCTAQYGMVNHERMLISTGYRVICSRLHRMKQRVSVFLRPPFTSCSISIYHDVTHTHTHAHARAHTHTHAHARIASHSTGCRWQ